jgi:hypothetical protein
MKQERAEHQKGLALTDPLQAGQAGKKGVSSPLEAQAPRGTAQDLTTKDFTVEEAFAQFSVLHGVKGRLQQFGYDFFDTQATSFAPVLDAPVGPDYVVGPQDSLSIHIWNVPDQSLNRSYIVPVERDGMIIIPQIGAISVGGLTFSQAERAITSRLSAHLKRFEVHVAMARLRTIKVYVVGEVVRPGAYEISSLATVSNAMYAACGPARSGSCARFVWFARARSWPRWISTISSRPVIAAMTPGCSPAMSLWFRRSGRWPRLAVL